MGSHQHGEGDRSCRPDHRGWPPLINFGNEIDLSGARCNDGCRYQVEGGRVRERIISLRVSIGRGTSEAQEDRS